jgi:hypothetical protein
MKQVILAGVFVIASSVYAESLIWSNIVNKPDDLMATEDAWTAARAEDAGFKSYRIAAEDFHLTELTKITRISFYAMNFDADILGGDWYIYESTGGGPPGKLITGEAGLPLIEENTGWWSNTFQDYIMRQSVMPTNLVLGPGHYFAAFRSLITLEQGGGKNSILTTRTSIADTRAYWNFGVLANGSVTDTWYLMETFNLVKENEWAFEIYGEVVPEPTSILALGTGLLFILKQTRKRR